MKKIKLFKKIAIGLCALALSIVTVGLPILYSVSPEPVSADAVEYTESVNALDSTSVLDDLGEDYVKSYANQTSGQIQLHSFMEYCYSGKPTVLNTKYGLYLYIYNPSRTEFEERTGWEYNTATLASSYNADGAPAGYSKLRMKNCGHTTGAYDKLFYKFRIIGLEDIVQGLRDMDEQYGYRRYDISEIELRVKGNTTGSKAYAIARTYTYKGYAEGCGATEESTLVCEQSEMDVIENLPVHQTVWRPEGNNGKSEYTQDSLHSIYFSVPNAFIEKYGDMYAVHAMWREAILKPALVTGNQAAYYAILPFLGKNIDGHTDSIPYAYLGAESNVTTGGTVKKCEISYNAYENMRFHPLIDGFGTIAGLNSKNAIDALYLMFNASGVNADDAHISSEIIEEQMIEMTKLLGGYLVNDEYSSGLFSYVADKWEEVNYNAGDTWNGQLTSQVIDKNWYQKHFGLSSDKVDEFNFEEVEGISAVQKVNQNDLVGSVSDVAGRLYISKNDYTSLMDLYAKANRENETVYIYRYAVSDYTSYEATLWEQDKILWADNWNEVDTNAYFFSETMYLNFDVIDVTFKKGEVKTVIPVVMTPIDIFPESTPPIDTTTDKPVWDWETLLPGIGGGNDSGLLTKLQKIIAYVIAGAVVLIVVVIVGIVISKIRNGHMRRETYKNTKPRYKRRK